MSNSTSAQTADADEGVLEEIRDRLNEILDGQTEMKTDVSSLKSDMKVVKTDVSEIKEDVSFIKDVLIEFSSDFDNHEQRLKNLEKASA